MQAPSQGSFQPALNKRALFFMPMQVSPEDEWLLAAHAWRVDPNGYQVAWVGVDGRKKLAFLHRMITSAPAGVCVDHIDGDPSNNRRENLRLCTHAENMKNRKTHKNNKTGIKGVYRKPSGSYAAEIKCDGRKFRLGTFDWPSDAALAYRLAAIHLHGEFARLG